MKKILVLLIVVAILFSQFAFALEITAPASINAEYYAYMRDVKLDQYKDMYGSQYANMIVYWGTSSRMNIWFTNALYYKAQAGGLNSINGFSARHIQTAWSLGNFVETTNGTHDNIAIIGTNTTATSLTNILYSTIDIYAADGVTVLREANNKYEYDISQDTDGFIYYKNTNAYPINAELRVTNNVATSVLHYDPTPLRYQGSKAIGLGVKLQYTLNPNEAIKLKKTVSDSAILKLGIKAPTTHETESGAEVWSYTNDTQNVMEVYLKSKTGEVIPITIAQTGVPTSTHQVGTTEYMRVLMPAQTIVARTDSGRQLQARVITTQTNPEEQDLDPTAEAQILSPADLHKTIHETVLVKVKYTYNPKNPLTRLWLTSSKAPGWNLVQNDSISVAKRIERINHSMFSRTDVYLVPVPLVNALGITKITAEVRKTNFIKSPASVINVERVAFVPDPEEPMIDQVTGERLDANWQDIVNQGGYNSQSNIKPNTDSNGNVVFNSTYNSDGFINDLANQGGQVQGLFKEIMTVFPPEFLAIMLFGLTLAVALRVLGR